MRVRHAAAVAGDRAVHLVPALLLFLFVASGTAAVGGATSHRQWLTISGAIALVLSMAMLVLWLIRRDQQMRQGDWSSFEKDFWSYVNRWRSGDGSGPPAEPPNAP
jgi:uncharacterized membrane protein